MKKCIAFFVVFFSLITTTTSAELILSGGKLQPDGSIIVKGGFSGGFMDNDGGGLFFRTNILNLDPNSNNVSLLRNNDVAYSTTGIHDGNLFKFNTSQVDVGDIYSEVFPTGGLFRMWFNNFTSTGGTGCSIPFCPGDIFAQFSLGVGGDIFASLFNNGQRYKCLKKALPFQLLVL